MNSRSFVITNNNSNMLLPKPFLFELAMEEYIIEHPEVLTLSKDYVSPKIEGYEIAKRNRRYDIVARYDNADTIAIIETKKGILDQQALTQLIEYLTRDANSLNPLIADNKIGILIGTNIDNSIISSIENSSNLFAIVINRYNSDINETIHTMIYSPNNAPRRDYTKYTLTSKTGDKYPNLGKSRLAYEIIHTYLKDNKCTLRELQKTFPKTLANRGEKSNMPIIRENKLKPGDRLFVRYFKEPLRCSDKEIIVCNQWGIGNIDGMINKAKELGMQITTQN